MESENPIRTVLGELIERYRQAYLSVRGCLPQVQVEEAWPSPCLPSGVVEGDWTEWNPVARLANEQFDQVEAAMAIELHSDANYYWNSFFSQGVIIDTSIGAVELLQPWNDDDYVRFQQNLVGHLLTQKRFKIAPSVFIGVQVEGEKVLTVNAAGQVLAEVPGRKQQQVLAEQLAEFLASASPVILPD